jgi:hypothetical protein
MSQLLNLVFDSTVVRLFRSSEGNANLLNEVKIESAASFFLENLKELVRKNHQHPELIRIYFSPEKYTLVPSSLFLPSKLEDYFLLNFESSNSDHVIQYEPIVSLGSVLVYSVPNWIVSFKSEINAFGDLKTVLGRNLTLINDQNRKEFIACSIQQGKMDVIAISNGKLQLVNQYEIQNEEDVSYFLLLIIQKLSLSSSTILKVMSISPKIDLNRFKTITDSIGDLNHLTIEIIDHTDFFNSILCA